ncbi:MAG: polysaccharide deacetylase family protein [Phycisphaerae bacterium]|nr:polysaccharide deacetylase family protein [Phycisphaerae bacterium]MDD5381704.1 polysaccharide deacetylase family protein [Phycisphaerae bacterium]
MNIIITSRNGFRHQIFLSKAVEYFGSHISRIYIQDIERKEDSCSCYGKIRNKLSAVKHKILSRGRKNLDDYLRDLYDNIDSGLWKKSNAVKKYVIDINRPDVQKEIYDLKPDLILIFGGKILKDAWVDGARYGSINLHYGILPYYRSSHSTQFALYHEAYEKLGATIHYIDKGVDTGPIISKFYVQPNVNDLQELMANIFKGGIDALIRTALKIINGEKVTGNSERSEDSYFPGKAFNDRVKQTANLRLKVLNKYRFPCVSRALRNIQNKSSYSLVNLKKRNRLENGVYIFLYHSLVDSNNCKEWERCCTKVLTYKKDFCDHINYLSENANCVKLSEVPKILYKGSFEEPYYAVTFDDGYSNILDNAFEICKKKGVYPAVFVNSNFASQRQIYYRVLLGLLLSRGCHNDVRAEITKIFNINDEISLFDFCKKYYRYGETERIISSIWNKCFADEKIRCHLDWNQLRFLQENGWEIGNHTMSHPVLSKLSYEQQKIEIEKNYQEIQQNGLNCIKWLSFPNGKPWDINEDTRTWMGNNPDWYGIVVANGYNHFYSQNEYLRIGIVNDNIRQFKNKIACSNYNIKSLLKGC